MSMKSLLLLCHLPALPWLLALSPALVAGDVYRWSDAQGQVHFSDAPPADGTMALQRTLPHGTPAPAQGLRTGERKALRTYHERKRREQRAAASRSAQATQRLEERRSDCRTARDKLHAARELAQRKQQSSYLRKHCW